MMNKINDTALETVTGGIIWPKQKNNSYQFHHPEVASATDRCFLASSQDKASSTRIIWS